MSRGFVKEDDQEDIPIVPPRAHLPEGAENFVTKIGMEELLSEKEQLLSEQENLDRSPEKEYRIAFNHLQARLQLLNERISSAKIIDYRKFTDDEVHFGATVTFKNLKSGEVQRFQITGVDEANIKRGKISYITPLASALLNKKVGEQTILDLGREKRKLEIVAVSYD